MEKREPLLFLLLVIFWALNYSLIKLALNYVQPFYLTFLRLLLTLPFLAILVPRGFKPIPGIKKNIQILIFGLFGIFGTWTLWYLGEYYITSSLAAIIMYTYPITTMALSSSILKEKLSAMSFSGMILGFIGVIMIFYEQFYVSNIIGPLLVFLSSICWSISIIFYKKTLSNESYATVNTYQMIYALPFTIALVFFNPMPIYLPLKFWLVVLLLAFPGTALAFTIYVFMYSKYSVNSITPYLFLVPAISVIFSYIIFRTEFTMLEIIGFLFLSLGIYLTTKRTTPS
ncbi:MAG: DMT family transporter [Nitrososphaerota archaeon]|jgi:drug/metabolite transporter (DMT)-like permease|nr:DMT family transporter [Nitrososphaerota archaeon]MDG6926845.1 DMT family transporter [Nitrososphaerota archaeon]MDG6930037.1 DMT family transporter [Nitrososphaerota archaeon]MDG6931988.1 DMT family transporter [Nitrososphaerota archaeon]MDG6943809.1 DMT family transporter [Nitrososphaerota archaeon]